MAQEDKELLLKDLCARLPYGVMIHIEETNESEELYCLNIPQEGLYTRNKERHNISSLCPIEQAKPYLRPMSSMTEEEKKELINIGPYLVNGNNIVIGVQCNSFVQLSKCEEWLNKKMFDYRGLIPMGLAIAVTEENNPYEN